MRVFSWKRVRMGRKALLSSAVLSNMALLLSDSYRLAPKYHFPVQFEDVFSASKFFLQSRVLSQYRVDPARVCVAGDSAGGNLAAAVAQKVRGWLCSTVL